MGLDTLVAHIAVLAQLSLRVPDAFEQKSDVIMAFLVKHVLKSSFEEEEPPPPEEDAVRYTFLL